MRTEAIALAATLLLTPLGASAADLAIWWQKGFYAQEDEGLRATVAAFEQKTGRQVELVLYPEEELATKIMAALEADRPPDFAFGLNLNFYVRRWAFEDRLVDLTDAVGSFSSLFDPAQFDMAVTLDARTGRRALYALPMGQTMNNVHVWKSLLERAGLSLNDVPKEWEGFWSFWCDRVQPAVRKGLGRSDIWGVGLAMSAGPVSVDTMLNFLQFVDADDADYVTRDGRLVIDDPKVRQKLIRAIDSYTGIYRKGCTPPESLNWDGAGNNQAFLAQAVVMTPNASLSIPNALKRERPDDYYRNTATIQWPLGPAGEAFPLQGLHYQAVAFARGAHVDAAKEFVRFLVAEGWLMHYLDFSGERMLPSIPALLDQPFWLDPSDPHHMAAVIQAKTRPLALDYSASSGDPRHDTVFLERVWAKAVHRVAADGISPEQAVDEAIARIKQILSE
jgi:multiple sugar transport system substrate-binding protein